MNPARPDPPVIQPGPDEIIISPPGGRHLCNSRDHRQTGRLADVLVAFGQFGSHWDRDAFWPEVWGRSYPMCETCWKQTRAVIERTRPHLVIRELPAS